MKKAVFLIPIVFFVLSCGGDQPVQEEWKSPDFCECVGHMAEIFRGERESFYDGTFALIYEGEHEREMDSCVVVLEREVNSVNEKNNFDSEKATQGMVKQIKKCKDGDKYVREYSAFLKNKLSIFDTISEPDAASKKMIDETELLLKYYNMK